MTTIKPNTNLTRETNTLYRHRPLVVELHPTFLRMREKGRRFTVDVDYRAVYDLGFKILDRQKRAEKAAQKRTRNRKNSGVI